MLQVLEVVAHDLLLEFRGSSCQHFWSDGLDAVEELSQFRWQFLGSR